jgi:hypothetical protein
MLTCRIVQVVRTADQIVKEREIQVTSNFAYLRQLSYPVESRHPVQDPENPMDKRGEDGICSMLRMAKELAKADYNFLEEPSFGGDMHIVAYLLHRPEEIRKALPVPQLVEEEGEDYETDDSSRFSKE